MNLRVILADDHPFVLLGIRAALEMHTGVTIVGEAAILLEMVVSSAVSSVRLSFRSSCSAIVRNVRIISAIPIVPTIGY